MGDDYEEDRMIDHAPLQVRPLAKALPEAHELMDKTMDESPYFVHYYGPLLRSTTFDALILASE